MGRICWKKPLRKKKRKEKKTGSYICNNLGSLSRTKVSTDHTISITVMADEHQQNFHTFSVWNWKSYRNRIVSAAMTISGGLSGCRGGISLK